MHNKKSRMLQLQDIPFWILFVFVFIGAIFEIAYGRFDLLPSIIPITTGMIIYVIFRNHFKDK